MNIVVAIKHIPSIADDLPVKGNNVDFDSVDFVLNEFDEQSIEQAVLVKEAVGGTVTVVGVDMIGELDAVLHLALAKGADKAIKITGMTPPRIRTCKPNGWQKRSRAWERTWSSRACRHRMISMDKLVR
ncbi:MAG: hypothetical protein IPG80_10565 [Anaerolineales bacterium]|uniref:hypothetical protein n=1 Tax=Candidatus Villigracilis vicinus TaxID=3140679 RepID=UPI0031352C3C|nr:hypothetical protein [Anaerolineales bacterium]